jgi:hypothetical protein
MPRTPWPWESEEEAERKAAEFRRIGIEGAHRLARRRASELAEFNEFEAAYRDTDDNSFAVKRDVAARKNGMRVFEKAREKISGRLHDDRARRKRLMRDLGMGPLELGKGLPNG